MTKIRIVDRDDQIVDCPDDTPILFALLDAGVNITCICGGGCSCGTCNVEVVEGIEHIPAPQDDETRVLSKIKRQGPNVRLACQSLPRDDVAIRIRPEDD